MTSRVLTNLAVVTDPSELTDAFNHCVDFSITIHTCPSILTWIVLLTAIICTHKIQQTHTHTHSPESIHSQQQVADGDPESTPSLTPTDSNKVHILKLVVDQRSTT